MQSIFWMFRRQRKLRNKSVNHIIMERKINNIKGLSYPYESPCVNFVEVKVEGVLCQSETSLFDEPAYLQDYNPSNGAW